MKEIPITPKKEKRSFKIEKLSNGKYAIIEDNQKNNSQTQEFTKAELNQAIEALKSIYDCEIDDSCLINNLNS